MLHNPFHLIGKGLFLGPFVSELLHCHSRVSCSESSFAGSDAGSVWWSYLLWKLSLRHVQEFGLLFQIINCEINSDEYWWAGNWNQVFREISWLQFGVRSISWHACVKPSWNHTEVFGKRKEQRDHHVTIMNTRSVLVILKLPMLCDRLRAKIIPRDLFVCTRHFIKPLFIRWFEMLLYNSN